MNFLTSLELFQDHYLNSIVRNKRLISKSQHQNQINFKHILNLCYIETIKYAPNFLDLINLGKI